ncbi:uridine kinase [Okibacterium sp. HSC-33S16]|uniref:ATP-binding protein n=1 Tax=Okibacterium sp. HSC-33S16 TaxID=2910965 RepID=UPI00209F72C1|nr:ATP-binding protein [Okibacterium sp. HSC-33S16]MCP2030606.1 uridine kinase [Okibacterium sp. HSC-33S16]
MPDVDREAAVGAIRSRVRNDGTDVILLDGPSGAGKSTLADALVAAWAGPVELALVRMDDIYPGWSGLAAAGEHVHDHLLVPRSQDGQARWQRHDWVRDAPAEWHSVPNTVPVLIEGCGVLTRANAPLASLTVWLDADDALRKERALARDAGAFDAHWEEWDAQFVRFVKQEDPLSSAKLVLRST